jgi:hypothetical protein
MGGSCQGTMSLRSSRVHEHWQIVKELNNKGGKDGQNQRRFDLLGKACQVHIIPGLFPMSLKESVHGETAHRCHGSINTGLIPKFLVIYRIVPACPKEFASTCPPLIGNPEDAPTPKPSPLIGLRRSTLRRESNA